MKPIVVNVPQGNQQQLRLHKLIEGTPTLIVGVAAISSLIFGCRLLPATGGSPEPTELVGFPTPPVVESASPQPMPSLEPSAGPTDSPSPASAPPVATPTQSAATDAEQSRSDAFWDPLVAVGALYNFEFDSMADMVADVDLIVRGRIEAVYVAPEKTSSEELDYIWATVTIDELVKGDPVTRNPGTIEVLLWRSGPWSEVRANVPTEEALFFLMNDTADARRRGDEIRDPDWSRFVYWRPNDQAVLRNIDGRVSVVARDDIVEEWGEDRFPVPLDGQPFDDVLSQVASLIE